MADPDALREVAAAWYHKALGDLEAARVLLAGATIDPDLAGFHAQQAAEKALKAVLFATDADVPRTHDLGRLRELVLQAVGPEADDLPAEPELRDLTEIERGSRYPDSPYTAALDREDLATAIERATRVVEGVRRFLDVR